MEPSRLTALLCESLTEAEPVSVIDVLKRAKSIAYAARQYQVIATVKMLMILYGGHPGVLPENIHKDLGVILDRGIAPPILREIRVPRDWCGCF